jgi:TM2 domain-containing membrane protein YozV
MHHVVVQDAGAGQVGAKAKVEALSGQNYIDKHFPTALIVDDEQRRNKGLGEEHDTQHEDDMMYKQCWSDPPQCQKDLYTAYLYLIFTGLFGGHHLYLGRPRFFLLYLFTAGGLGVGYLVDMFTLPHQVARANNPDKPVADFLGIDTYIDYLASKRFGAIQQARVVNEDGSAGAGMTSLPTGASIAPDIMPGLLEDCYAMWGLGFLGLHHFHLKNNFLGVAYLCTFGLLGVGWIVDLFRMPTLCKRAVHGLESNVVVQPVSLDVAYTCWMPCGLFGLHHLYLGDVWSFLLYLCTFGCLGLGWLIDGFRMPQLVAHVNAKRRYRAEVFAPFSVAAVGYDGQALKVSSSLRGIECSSDHATC